MQGDEARRAAELGRELEPDILPKQLRALARVAARLRDQRPAPTPELRFRLEDAFGGRGSIPDDPQSPGWRLRAALCLASGLSLLLAAALWVVAG